MDVKNTKVFEDASNAAVYQKCGIMGDVECGLQCERHLLEDVDYICLEYCGRNIFIGIGMLKMSDLLIGDGEWRCPT